MLRYLVVALAMTIAGATTASASWVTRDVNVRSGPGTGHQVRHVARGCSAVQVHGHRQGWVRVDTGHGAGWISARYVSNHRPQHCRARVQAQHHAPRAQHHAPRAQIHIYLNHQPFVQHHPHLRHRPRVDHHRPQTHHRAHRAVRGEAGIRHRYSR